LARLIASNGVSIQNLWLHEMERGDAARRHPASAAMVAACYVAYVLLLDCGSPDGFDALLTRFAPQFSNPTRTAVALHRVLGGMTLAAFPVLVDAYGEDTEALRQAMTQLMTATERGMASVGSAMEAAVVGEAKHVRQRHVQFAREVARIATRNRLRLVDPHEIPSPEGLPIPIQHPLDGNRLRRAAVSTAEKLDMDVCRAEDLALAVGEAVSNVLKHAGHGIAHVWKDAHTVYVFVSDDGHGIAMDDLPKALTPGWSSEPSLGMGFTLMLEMADALWLSTGSFGTRICIEKDATEEARPCMPDCV
jgi:anti-sigma regulatory factor (Ser/Thr protein kinase)